MAGLHYGLNSREQVDWLASLRLDPPEEDRADVRHALLAQLLVKLLGGKELPEAVFLNDLPWREPVRLPVPAAPTPVSFRQKLDGVMAMFGGRR